MYEYFVTIDYNGDFELNKDLKCNHCKRKS